MRLIDDAGKVWHRLWSVRLMLLAGAASAIDVGWQAYVTGAPRLLSIGTAALSFGAAVARLVAQPKARRG